MGEKIGPNTYMRPQYPVPWWNKWDAVLANRQRTNNAQESYHRSLARVMDIQRPCLKSFSVNLQVCYCILNAKTIKKSKIFAGSCQVPDL